MDFDLEPEDKLLRDAAKQVAASVLDPLLRSYPDAPLPREAVLEVLRAVRPLGMLGARLPASTGGDELSNVQLGVLFEHLPAEASMIASTNGLVAFRMFHGSDPDVRDHYVPALVKGEIIGATAISEPDTGSDLRAISTRAEKDGKYFRLSGRKMWSSGALVADVLLVAATVGRDDRGRGLVGRFVVDADTPGIEIRNIEMLGLERHSICEIVFDECRVPAENSVGNEHDGVAMLNRSWLSQRADLGLIAVHLADAALRASIRYARERVQFGRPIGSFQLIQAMLVDMATLVDTSRLLCYRALRLLDDGRDARYESSVAKYYATEAAVKVTSSAIQVHGALGLSREAGLEKLYRDARMLPIPDGTTEIQKLVAGRELLGLNALRG